MTTVSDLGNINSSGKITTTFVTGTTDRTRYVAVDDTAVLRDGDVIDGHELVSIVEAQLSGNEELVVYGWIPTDDGESLRRALFAGEGLILMEGQNLDGRTVARIRQNFEVNHRGDVAFQVVFNNGDHVLLLSTVPEPSAVATIILGFGSMMILFRRGP